MFAAAVASVIVPVFVLVADANCAAAICK